MEYILQDKSTLVVQHNSKVIRWSIKGFMKTPLTDGQEELNHVNDYINWLGWEWQDKFFEICLKIDEVFSNFGTFAIKQSLITGLVKELLDTINPDETVNWVENYSHINLSTNMRDEYSESDKDQDKTYLKGEYIYTVALAIWMKLLIGIFGTYLDNYQSILGAFKEYTALRLLEKSWVMTSQPMERLKRYIATWVKQVDLNEGVILKGLSSYELPNYVLAIVLIRKLGTASLDANVAGGGVIVYIYRGTKSAITDLRRHFPTVYDKEKQHKKFNKGEDKSNYSIAEMYKALQRVRTCDVAVYEYFIRHIDRNLHHIDPTLSIDEYRSCEACIPRLINQSVPDHTVVITQWVLQKLIPARMVYNLTKPDLYRLVVFAQALLWHWGFKDLALLITAVPDTDTVLGGVSFNASARRVKTDIMETLSELYPYGRPTKNKSNSATRDNNLVHKAISLVKEMFSARSLVLTPPDYMLEHAVTMGYDGRVVAPGDLPTQLAELLVKVGN